MEIVGPNVELWSITPDAETLIERCGRVAYQSESTGDPGSFIKKLIAWGDESVLEHASATLAFLTDRGVTHEFVRHRLCAFTQESTRYCRYTSGIRVIEPPSLKKGQRSTWLDGARTAGLYYEDLLGRGVAPQIARSVLPTCLATQIVVTANLRQWRHIVKLRLSPKAHPQIREIMALALAKLKKLCPNVFDDL